VLGLAVWTVIRGRDEVTVLGRRLPNGLVQRSLAVIVVTLTVFCTGMLVLTLAEKGSVPFVDLMFEAASAIGTVGVSAAGTPRLTVTSRTVLIPMMFLGRVGPLTLALALANRQGNGKSRLRFPEENVTIG